MANPEIRPLKLDGEIFYPPTISEQVIDPETNESVKFQISELNENLTTLTTPIEVTLTPLTSFAVNNSMLTVIGKLCILNVHLKFANAISGTGAQLFQFPSEYMPKKAIASPAWYANTIAQLAISADTNTVALSNASTTSANYISGLLVWVID